MANKILIIDDDKPMHKIMDHALKDHFEMVHAYNAQKGIDILSEEKINLVISDIYMPGLSGLQFLQVLKKDARKKQVPVLIMTNLPSVEKEKKALEYGAADFIKKSEIMQKKVDLVERVNIKLVTNVTDPDFDEDLLDKKNKIVTKILMAAQDGDFQSAVKELFDEVKEQFSVDYMGFWTLDSSPHLVYETGNATPENYDSAESLKSEKSFNKVINQRESYLLNNVFAEEEGMMLDFSKKHELSSEIAVPVFAADEREMLTSNMSVPDDADIYGFIVLKRNKLYTTQEYEMLSRLLKQTGSVLWRLYSNPG